MGRTQTLSGVAVKVLVEGHEVSPAIVVAARPIAPSEASRRWADLLRRIFEVDPLACIRGGGTMRIVAFITDRAVLDRMLTHLQTRATLARTPGPRGPPARRASLQQRPLHSPATAAASSPV